MLIYLCASIYRTGFTYDSLDRITGVTYPDNDAVGYTYNRRNLLQSIQGGVNGLTRHGEVIENITYRASGQQDSILYGNGILTQYAYDPRLRLTGITTAPEANPGSPLIDFAYNFDDASNIKAIMDNRPVTVVPAGNPRRNTQLFNYDDLYRITYAGYAFGPSGSTKVDGGSILYRYDRIGNMLAKTSDITATDPQNGLPVANLGQMNYGGNAGRFARVGRGKNEPPGPHALTSINNPAVPARTYDYDANGNMEDIDGLKCTWDFKDRLIGVENGKMRARYTYDYTDRRVIKRVWWRASSTNAESADSQPACVLYPSKYFDVRENDIPVKYVWNEKTRVARVTGSLSSNPRVQRLRLWPGWNLLSFAVNTVQHPVVTNLAGFVYLWNSASLSWDALSATTNPSAGAVVWLKVRTNAVTALTGGYPVSSSFARHGGPRLLRSEGLNALTLSLRSAHKPAAVWQYDAKEQVWRSLFQVPWAQAGALDCNLGPGEVVMLSEGVSSQRITRTSALRIHYYHQDHLGSNTILSDGSGRLVGQNEQYPYGYSRVSTTFRGITDSYKFIDKENDTETGLASFGRRLYATALGRFVSVDRLDTLPSSIIGGDPMSYSPYEYALDRPIVIYGRA